MSWYESIFGGIDEATGEESTGIFGWLEQNEAAASFIGGAALGALKYQSAREERKFQREMIQDERAYREKFGGASTVGADEYAQNLTSSTGGVATGGATTQGDIAKMSDLY
jgi:hypothetical protein